MRKFFSVMTLMVATEVVAGDWHDAAIEMIRNEPKVVEAMFPHDGGLWVSVAPDGTPRDGLAEYMCLVMLDAGKPPKEFVVVHIWDAAAMARGALVEIGRSDCYSPDG